MDRAHTPAWRNFKRMQDCACLVACLIYAGAVVHAWRVLPGPAQQKLVFTLAAPLIFLVLTLLLPLVIGGLRRLLRNYVWLTFLVGFGQTPVSVISGIGVLAFAALFIYLQVAGVSHGGRYPAGVFSAYAAGIGILIVQAVLVRSLERDPDVQARIAAPQPRDT